MKTYTILEHFNYDEDPDCDGDFDDIEVLDETGKVIASYGDYYHEKGQDKAIGFIDGVRYASGEDIEINWESKADRSW